MVSREVPHLRDVARVPQEEEAEAEVVEASLVDRGFQTGEVELLQTVSIVSQLLRSVA